MTIDTTPWGDLELVHRVEEGNRNEVWRGVLDGTDVSVRRSRRSTASLDWELNLIARLAELGFRVPEPVATASGTAHENGVVVQRWLDGRPPTSDDDWRAVAAELQRLHACTGDVAQRPDCCAAAELRTRRRSVDADLDAMPSDEQHLVLEVLERFVGVPTSVIHGDPHESNIRIDGDGRVGLLDWDESRVDVAWHDLSNLRVSVLDAADQISAEQLSDAWEAVNGWVAEPAYARRRLEALAAALS